MARKKKETEGDSMESPSTQETPEVTVSVLPVKRGTKVTVLNSGNVRVDY